MLIMTCQLCQCRPAVPKILWFNYRKEPTVYINGQPCSPRDPADLHHNISVTGASGAS